MSSPNLNIVTLLGSGLTYTSAYLFGIQEQSLPSGDSVEKLIQVSGGFAGMGTLMHVQACLYVLSPSQRHLHRLCPSHSLSPPRCSAGLWLSHTQKATRRFLSEWPSLFCKTTSAPRKGSGQVPGERSRRQAAAGLVKVQQGEGSPKGDGILHTATTARLSTSAVRLWVSFLAAEQIFIKTLTCVMNPHVLT